MDIPTFTQGGSEWRFPPLHKGAWKAEFYTLHEKNPEDNIK